MRLIIALLAIAAAAYTAEPFECSSDLNINDSIRKLFLDFHNEGRRKVAKNGEGKLKSAKNMYKLVGMLSISKETSKEINLYILHQQGNSSSTIKTS
ncbi:hypothetical protein ANCCAN_20982 [Ancylostoma caninum]|uniref:SCP domain-containing protein n=1 Tax=Ancylostoma caninum TaxID=29170 RepID=A0A368FNT7_ANCCA|nr:hypothetical protein ANCCAN_20982 [Ancylostoma caninum]